MYKYIKGAYDENEVLAREYPFEVYYPLIVQFVVKEIRLKKVYMNPVLFANETGIEDKKAIRFFLGMLDSTLFDMVYEYECPHCNEKNICETEEELINLLCSKCSEKINYTYEELIKEIKVLFKINPEIVEKVKLSQYVD